MKKAVILFFVSAMVLSCQQKIDKKDLSKINGYWEIEKVILPNGEEKEKEYKVNESIDYFAVKDSKGFREKVMPQLDGKYIVNDLKENIVVVEKEGDFFIRYTTPYAKWSEQIIVLSDKELVLKNEQKLEYHYKKPIPFSIK